MTEVPLAAGMGGRQAQLSLLLAAQRLRWGLGVAPVAGVDAVDHRAAITDESEQRADAIHGPSIATPRRWRATGLREMKYPGDDLFSQEVAPQVSSALESLTSVFGMGTGGSSPLASPG